MPSPRKNHDLGASVQSDGVQVIARWEKAFQRTLSMSSKKHAERQERHRAKAALAAQYADQQRRLAEGETLGEDEKKIDGKRLRTKRWLVPDAPVFRTEGLLSSKRGLFKQSAIPSVSKASLPTVVAIDPFGDTATSGQQADSTSR